jgi:hypothetical protein
VLCRQKRPDAPAGIVGELQLREILFRQDETLGSVRQQVHLLLEIAAGIAHDEMDAQGHLLAPAQRALVRDRNQTRGFSTHQHGDLRNYGLWP